MEDEYMNWLFEFYIRRKGKTDVADKKRNRIYNPEDDKTLYTSYFIENQIVAFKKRANKLEIKFYKNKKVKELLEDKNSAYEKCITEYNEFKSKADMPNNLPGVELIKKKALNKVTEQSEVFNDCCEKLKVIQEIAERKLNDTRLKGNSILDCYRESVRIAKHLRRINMYKTVDKDNFIIAGKLNINIEEQRTRIDDIIKYLSNKAKENVISVTAIDKTYIFTTATSDEDSAIMLLNEWKKTAEVTTTGATTSLPLMWTYNRADNGNVAYNQIEGNEHLFTWMLKLGEIINADGKAITGKTMVKNFVSSNQPEPEMSVAVTG